MKKFNITNVVGSVVLLSAVICLGADATYSPVANLTERWTNDAAWKVTGDGSAAVVDESMSLAYASQAMPITQIGSLTADGISSGGRFTGNYSNSAITHASFDVMRVGLSAYAYLQFTCNNGHVWMYKFALPTDSGVWKKMEIPFTFSDSWKSYQASGQESFDGDRSQVKDLEVEVITTGSGAQQVRIDNFKVLGPWEKGPMTTDEMPLYWLIEHGLTAGDGQALLDPDADGFNNYREYLAGTDPNNSSSFFRIAIETDVDGKQVVTWKRENYRSYKVLRSADLTVADSFVAETGAIQASGDMNKISVDNGAGVGFYRVEVDKLP